MEIKVSGSPDLVRDGKTGAILNKAEGELEKYRNRRAELLRDKDREREFQSLKSEVKDLKAMMLEIYEKVVNNK